MALARSTRLGTYEIVSPLGSGGMGEVYRARDSKLLREVAIKILPPAVAADPERLARFEREARVLASLNHSNIGTIYGLEDAAGIPALVLELVEGPTLEERIAAGPVPVAEALAIARQVIAALEAAHERGIVHRDLKPANIKLTPDGTVKVLDFGLAKAVADEGQASAVAASPTVTAAATREGIILGTAPYMSPEQARGQLVDRRTDVWAFGCVLYEMMTRQRAFGGATISDAIVSVLEREPDYSALPPDTPPSVRRLLRRALRKDARSRLRDIGDARLDIDDALGPAAADEATAPVAHPGWRRRTMVWSVATSLVTALLLAGGWFLYSATRVQPPAFSRVIRFVSTAAHEFGPAIATDGKWAAYLSNARGPTDVWVKFLAGGDPVNLTASQPVSVQEQSYISGLEISPDGSLIAFTGGPPGQQGQSSTWVIPAPLGGVPRRFLPVPFHGIRWSPDGTKTAFMLAGGSAGDSLWVGDADGQNGREIVKAQGGLHVHWIRWSSDSRSIYFNYGIQNFNTAPTEIFRVGAEGGAVEPVVTTTRRAAYAVASPDGRGLFYAANPDSVDLGLWWRDLRSGAAHRLTSGVGEYTEPSVSADGRRVVATVLDARQSLARIRVDGSDLPTLGPITDGFTGDFDPVWSPDRTRLVFSSSRTGAQNLWWMGGDLTAPSPLTVGNAMDVRPSFSRDGQQLAFVSDRGNRLGIWTMAAENGTPRLVAASRILDGVSWSPDGQRLVAAIPGPTEPSLITIGVSDGKIERLSTPAGATAPAWSPVDDVIAYLEPKGPPAGTRLRFVTGGGHPRVDFIAPDEPTAFGNGLLAWSADGRKVAVVSLPGASTGSLWIADVAAPPRWRKILDLPAGVHLRGVTWSQDGSELIVGVIRWSGDIILAERTQ